MTAQTLRFPDAFFWGTATAAHQVEGNNSNNDWWDFEQRPGAIHDGSRSGAACDQFHRFREDFDLAKRLNTNAHRLSLEWSRLEPTEGRWDEAAFAHYRTVIEALRERGLEPFVTLHHFTNPRWLAADGGWENARVVERFERYAARCAEAFGDLVTHWITINEPMVYVVMGYFLNQWPPRRDDPIAGFRVAANMLRAHARAYGVLHRKAKRTPSVGIAHHIRIFDPANPNSPLDINAARFQHFLMNGLVERAVGQGVLVPPLGVFERLPGPTPLMDFFGINYYTRDMVAFDITQATTLGGRNFPAPGARLQGFGWEVYPEGLYRLCVAAAEYGKPIHITENGVPDNTDELRPSYLVDHLTAVHRAIAAGAPVAGYFHWSLIDNFEWAEGFTPRFGLIEVDYATQQRRIKKSGEVYARICAAKGIPGDFAVG